MTINEIARQLLGYFAPEERGIPDAVFYPGRNAAVIQVMNAALQEIHGKGLPWVRFDKRGVRLRAPARVELAVTENTPQVEVIQGWQYWMAGCSVVIDGAGVDNQFRDDWEQNFLMYPHEGTSGTVGATVYHDCVALGQEVLEVLDLVRLDRRPLARVVSADAPSGAAPADDDYGFHRRSATMRAVPRLAEQAGTPLAYAVETRSTTQVYSPLIHLRLSPAPDHEAHLDFRFRSMTPAVVADLNSSDLLPFPRQFIQSIYLPIARQRLSGCPFFRAEGALLQETARAYQEALALLESLNPCKESGAKLKTLY